MVTINGLLRESKIPLKESILILCKILDVDKSYIYTYGDKEITVELIEEFKVLMDKRSTGYPLQYILGSWEFMGLDFYLEEGVLVPRPDTEILVEYIIEYINKTYPQKNIRVLDLGTGSGAISLSVANYCKYVFVYGVDISDKALKIAQINKRRLDISNVEFYKGDLFQPLGNGEENFEVIVSNPPYIPRDEIDDLDTTVRDFEPRLALDGGKDGLVFYRRITSEGKEYLKDNGLLIYEIGYNQGEDVRDILELEGFRDVKIIKDLQGHDRVVLGFLRR